MPPLSPPPAYDEIGTWLRQVDSASPDVQNLASLPARPLSSSPEAPRLRKRTVTSPLLSSLGRRLHKDSTVTLPLRSSSSIMLVAPSDRRVSDDAALGLSSIQDAPALFDQVTARLNDAISQAGDHEPRLSSSPPITSKKLPRTGLIDFKKTWLYANSRLPPHLFPMRVYLDTWRIICLAATSSLEAYNNKLPIPTITSSTTMPTLNPSHTSTTDLIPADHRTGTKALLLSTRTHDDTDTIVLAIRGSRANLVDWTVNFGTRPTKVPDGWLDDEGNACHAGFLRVAVGMVEVVAARVRKVLDDRERRTGGSDARRLPSLVLTGHSAGGAVAVLLYMHMLSTARGGESRLRELVWRLKRVHCVTFGTPPLSLLPMQTPTGRSTESSVFFTFVNEGDVIARADRQYLGTIARVLAAPAPIKIVNVSQGGGRKGKAKEEQQNLALVRAPWCEIPPATLSLPGAIMVMREKPGHKPAVIEAVRITDADLRTVMFGDPAMHAMELYRSRIEELAAQAVIGRPAE